MFTPLATRTHEAMQPVLMSPEAAGPALHYYMIRGGKDTGNVTVLAPGTVGGEYLKTFGHYHVGNISETYRIVSGEGIILLQKRVQGKDDEVEWVRAVRVKAGDSVFIPSELGHLMVNTGAAWLVTVDDSPVNTGNEAEAAFPGHADYEPVKKQRGFAYYVVEKNSQVAFVANALYRNTPPIIEEELV